MVKTKSKRESDKSNLSSQFFSEIIKTSVHYAGDKVVDEFKNIKALRDKYIEEKWDEISGEVKFEIFREVDYEYIISLLKNNLPSYGKDSIDVYFNLIKTCFKYGEYDKAESLLDYLEDRIEYYAKDKLSEFYMLNAKLNFYKNKLDISETYYENSLYIYEELGDIEGLIKVYNNLGIISYEFKWDTEKGKEYFKKAAELFAEANKVLSDDINVNIQMNLGIIDDVQGEFSEAYNKFSELINSYNDSIDKSTYFNISLNKGYSAKNFGDYESAEQSISYLLGADIQTPTQRLIGIANLLLAEIYILKRQFNDSREYLIQAFKIFSKLHDRVSLADTYRVFGLLYRNQGNYELAQSQFQISLDLNEEYQNLLNLTETHYEFSLLFRDLDDPVSRRVHLESALSYAESMGATKRAERLRNELDSIG